MVCKTLQTKNCSAEGIPAELIAKGLKNILYIWKTKKF